MEQPQISVHDSMFDLSRKCGAYYKCRKDSTGRRSSPLAGYTFRDEGDKQLVGDEYLDFAWIEQWPDLVDRHIIARNLMRKIGQCIVNPVGLVWCGMPEGGRALATLLGRHTRSRHIFQEKVTLKVATDTEKAVTMTRFTGRHIVYPGERVVLVEDVSNNFSTPTPAIGDVLERGASVAGIVCFLKRSQTVRETYHSKYGPIPVIAAWDHPMDQWRQNDAAVAEDIAAGNVVLDPKKHWGRMQEAMKLVA